MGAESNRPSSNSNATADDESAGSDTGNSSASADSADGHVRTIGHDEFDPIGTLVLVTMYFFILGVSWVFTYFIEFLGRSPTPVGV